MVFIKEKTVFCVSFYLTGHNKNDLIHTRHQMNNNTCHYLLEKIKQSRLKQGRNLQGVCGVMTPPPIKL